MSQRRGRAWWISFLWSARDYLKRVWDNSAEDNVLFLAGGIAFNILLAAIPFVLLLIAGLTVIVPAGDPSLNPSEKVNEFIDRRLHLHTEASGGVVQSMLTEALGTR